MANRKSNRPSVPGGTVGVVQSVDDYCQYKPAACEFAEVHKHPAELHTNLVEGQLLFRR